MDLVAELHGATWLIDDQRPDDQQGAWATRDWEPARWTDRLTSTAQRYPAQYDAATTTRLASFGTEAAAAYDVLAGGPRSWIHHDPHPDNALWRHDGRLVLLDWAGAMIAPPSIDVASLLMSLSFRANPPMSPSALLMRYRSGLQRKGVDTNATDVDSTAKAALRLAVRGVVGWTGLFDHRPPAGRALALRDAQPGRVVAALGWIDG